MASMFKKTSRKLALLTDIDMLLTIEKGIREGICHAIHRYTKVNNKKIGSSYLMYLDASNFYGWAMFQKFPANGFKWSKNVSKYHGRLYKKLVIKIVLKDMFLKKMLNILKIYVVCIVIYLSYQRDQKFINAISLSAICMIEKNLCCSYKIFKADIKSLINTNKSTHSNLI